jgi:hypothetical protein
VNQFGTPAGGSLGEVRLFQQEYRITTHRSINGNPETRSTATDDNEIPQGNFGKFIKKGIPVQLVFFNGEVNF